MFKWLEIEYLLHLWSAETKEAFEWCSNNHQSLIHPFQSRGKVCVSDEGRKEILGEVLVRQTCEQPSHSLRTLKPYFTCGWLAFSEHFRDLSDRHGCPLDLFPPQQRVLFILTQQQQQQCTKHCTSHFLHSPDRPAVHYFSAMYLLWNYVIAHAFIVSGRWEKKTCQRLGTFFWWHAISDTEIKWNCINCFYLRNTGQIHHRLCQQRDFFLLSSQRLMSCALNIFLCYIKQQSDI